MRFIFRFPIYLTIPALLILTACNENLNTSFDETNIQYMGNNNQLSVKFFGTSTFLIEDNKHQVIIDGFFTRTKHEYLRKIAPSHSQIQKTIAKHNICKSQRYFLDTSNPKSCRDAGKVLKLIIPVHGHYDHALDAPYLAAWSGAEIIADRSVNEIKVASEKYKNFQKHNLRWAEIIQSKPFIHGNRIRRFSFGDFIITLFKTPHNKNISSPFVHGVTGKFNFPVNIWKLKEGTNLAVHIKYKKSAMLIIPSAGDFSDETIPAGLTGSVIFLGIGGINTRSRKFMSNYWKNTVIKARAKTVIPIHWDNDQINLPSDDGDQFEPLTFSNFHSTLKKLKIMAGENSGVSIKLPPPTLPFNPFI